MEFKKILRMNTPRKKSPALYETDRGTYAIQGYKIPETEKPKVEDYRLEDEDVIEVPTDLIRLIVAHFRDQF